MTNSRNDHIVEADYMFPTTEGLRCVVVFLPNAWAPCGTGHRCGYVGITREHPLFDVHYNETSPALTKLAEKANASPIGCRGDVPVLVAALTGGFQPTPLGCFDVHGSITYSKHTRDGYPAPYPELFWYGFDCAHFDDTEPGGRSLEYCKRQCESLARQLSHQF